MGNLGESVSFLGVKVNVVDPKVDVLDGDVGVRQGIGAGPDDLFIGGGKFNGDFDVVVLQGN